MLAYLDDIIIMSPTFESHLGDLTKVFDQLRKYNLTVNIIKCRFCCPTVKYLGHLITKEGLTMDPSKTSAIVNMPIPSNLKHLTSFLQTCSWYRRFIAGFAKIAEPLTRLTKKNAQWVWGIEQQVAYDKLKKLLTSAPILRQADETKPYLIKTDASSYAIGAVLLQGEGEDERPVEYASRLLSPAERNYNTTEREALAVVWAVSKFRGYIESLPVTVVTDHQALRWLMNLKSPTGRLARWALQLQSYNLTIKYSPGKTNVVADTLSRPSCTKENEKDCGICVVTIDMPKKDPAKIREEQIKDENIQRIIKSLEDEVNFENARYWSEKGYIMNNGLLYRNSPSVDTEDAQLVVPQHEWMNVVSIYHDDPLAGHGGSEKTYNRISKRYFWSGMRKYIEGYVKNCVPCQRYKPANWKPAGLLQTTTMNQRFEVLAFDLFGPLPPSKKNNTLILVVEDIASRWVELFALEAATAKNCAATRFLEEF
ncbi:jg13466 [Pararge aegeria aegeria]|uniref:RNA-directed DNA polymerase n=1 Tax=Pararge aegeria aegeria TaxID=348720 RepID=A0A8S4RHY5_9NEOP|nr:jg13466 [Pararge aegeria aegeria]